MDTPICDFVKKYAEENKIRMHMPGHKGRVLSGAEPWDITEIDGADVLYSAKGIIKKSEENASLFFGTKKTLYSTEGSSLSIRATVHLLTVYGKKLNRNKIAAGRNAHKTFITAAALNGIEVDWLWGEENGGITQCKITAETLRNYFSSAKELPVAVYITSPDYIGNMADIKGISEECKKRGVLLAVDNAHGAYLKFLPESLHPIDMGADICCDSAHKTLPVLTGGGYLHISENAPSFLAEKCENAMSVFASTSPSYLILQSLDRANLYISQNYKEKLSLLCSRLSEIKKKLEKKGFELSGNELGKLILAPKSFGYTGIELAALMEKRGIICEFSDPDYTVFMLTPENTKEELIALTDALLSVPEKPPVNGKPPVAGIPEKALSLREALFSDYEEIPVSESEGRIAASLSVSCPPAIPVITCGEVIDKTCIGRMKYYGIETVKVIK